MRIALWICLASASAHAQAVTGRVDIISAPSGVKPGPAVDTFNGNTESRVLGTFAHGPIDDVLDHAGLCTISRRTTADGVDAGTITIDGVGVFESVPAGGNAGRVYGRDLATSPRPGTTLRVEIAGTGEVPNVVATVQMPAPIPDFVLTATEKEEVATWTPVPNAGDIELDVLEHESPSDRGVMMVCRVPDTGRFAISRSLFASMPSGPRLLVPVRIARATRANVEIRAVQVGALHRIQPPPSSHSNPSAHAEAGPVISAGMMLAGSNKSAVVGGEVSLFRWYTPTDSSCRGPLCAYEALGDAFKTKWLGGYADGVYDFSRSALRFTLGPEVGASILGLDGGVVLQERKGAVHAGFAVRPVVTFGVVAAFVRYERVAGENVAEGGVLIKYPVKH